MRHCPEGNPASGRSRAGGVLGGPSAGKNCRTEDALQNGARAKSSFCEAGSLESLSEKMGMGLVVQGGKGPSAPSNGQWAPGIILVQGVFQVVIQWNLFQFDFKQIVLLGSIPQHISIWKREL